MTSLDLKQCKMVCHGCNILINLSGLTVGQLGSCPQCTIPWDNVVVTITVPTPKSST